MKRRGDKNWKRERRGQKRGVKEGERVEGEKERESGGESERRIGRGRRVGRGREE